MKKLFAIAALSIVLLFAGENKATAQAKFGYFDLDYVVSLMPGIGRVDTTLQIFERDSIGQEYQFRLSEFQRNDSTLKADSAKMPAKLYQDRRANLYQDFYLLQNWQQYSQQAIQAKQQELTQPFLQKAVAAFQTVKTRGGYTYVFKRESLWDAPPADNLIIPVLKELKISVPAELQPQGQVPAGGTTRPATPPTRR